MSASDSSAADDRNSMDRGGLIRCFIFVIAGVVGTELESGRARNAAPTWSGCAETAPPLQHRDHPGERPVASGQRPNTS